MAADARQRPRDASGSVAAASGPFIDGRQILRRVREERQLIESRAQQMLTTRASVDGAGLARPFGKDSTPAVLRSPWGDQVGAGGMAQRPVDLQGLTDQVVQAINKRIVAQRERLGRIS
jgi:hypothetical protein